MNFELAIIIILPILILYSTFISTNNELVNKQKKGFKSLTKQGVQLIVINLGMILLLVFQYVINENETKKNNVEFKENQEIRDSVLKANYDSSLVVVKSKFDSSTLKIISTVTKALGKYNHELDSTNENLALKLRKYSSIPDDPVLYCIDFKRYNRVNNLSYFKLEFTSRDASCTGININCDFFGSDSENSYKYLTTDKLFSSKDRISKNSSKIFYINLINEDMYKIIFIHVKGTYKNSDKSKTLSIDDSHYYNVGTNSFTMLKDYSEHVEIIKMMKKNDLEFYTK
jgi:hypothetical protein